MATGLPKDEFTYTWVEDDTELGVYTATTETVGTITYLINKYEPEAIDIEITKKWEDEEDKEGLRPDHVDVKLLADGTVVQTVRLDGDEYKATVKDLPKYADGEEIEYTFEEYPVEGYETTVGELTYDEENEIWTIEIENTH